MSLGTSPEHSLLGRLGFALSQHKGVIVPPNVAHGLQIYAKQFVATARCSYDPSRLKYGVGTYIRCNWNRTAHGQYGPLLPLPDGWSRRYGCRTDYPSLASWRQDAPGLFRHNTLGLTAKRLPRGAALENPQVTASLPEDWSQGQSYSDEGQGAVEGDEEEYERGEAVLPRVGEEIAVREQEHLAQLDTNIDRSSSSKGKMVICQVQLKVKDGGFYFRDIQDQKIWTTRTNWTSSGSGWQHTAGPYFAERLPRGMR